MEIREATEGDVLVLAPDGSVAGAEETHAIETRFAAALKAGSRWLVLDCTAVGQLTSSAIRVLLKISRKLDRIDGRLVLCGMNAKLEKAFSISGFNKDFTVVATRQEALLRVVEAPAPRPVRSTRPAPPSPPPAEPSLEPSSGANAAAVPNAAAPALEPPTSAAAAPATVGPVPEDAVATALLDAMGVSSAGLARARPHPVAIVDAAALADAILDALRAPAP